VARATTSPTAADRLCSTTRLHRTPGLRLPPSLRSFGGTGGWQSDVIGPACLSRSPQPDDTMGIIAESIMAYAQPLLDGTDGSLEQMNRALTLAQICWNLAIMPEEARDKALLEMRPALKMEPDEFEAFQRTLVVPMIRRHKEMFPYMHEPGPTGASTEVPAPPSSTTPLVSTEKYPGTARNAPCPCNSGKKYKKCCGR